MRVLVTPRRVESTLAEDYVQKSLRFSPGDPRVLFQLANADYLRGNADAAKKYLTEVARKVEPNAEILWLMIRVERRLGDAPQRQTMLRSCGRKFPESQEYRIVEREPLMRDDGGLFVLPVVSALVACPRFKAC